MCFESLVVLTFHLHLHIISVFFCKVFSHVCCTILLYRLRQELKEERAGISVTADTDKSKISLSVPRIKPVEKIVEKEEEIDYDDSADDTSEDDENMEGILNKKDAYLVPQLWTCIFFL